MGDLFDEYYTRPLHELEIFPTLLLNCQKNAGVASPESNYLESKIATEISMFEFFRIELYRALQQWYNMNEILASFDPR